MKNILTCPPSHYDIEYEINPWMNITNKVESSNADDIYKQLTDIYREAGIGLYEIEPEQGLPDMIYTANIGYALDYTFIKSNFKYPQRRREADVAADYLKKTFGYKVVTLPEDIFFEGQGDLLTDGTRYFYGWGKRSDYLAKIYLQNLLDCPLYDFELVDPYYYHLDTCFAPLTEKIVIINPRSFTKKGIESIYMLFDDVIETSTEDNKVLACNLVHIGNTIVVGKGITQKLKNELKKRGYQTYEIDMKEYLKGGGSVKCASFEF